MELKVWVGGVQRVVCGVTEVTTCQDVIYALAHATGRTGRFVLIEKWRTSERSLSPADEPLRILSKWGEYATDIQLILRCVDDLPQSRPALIPREISDSSLASAAAVGQQRKHSVPWGPLSPVSGRRHVIDIHNHSPSGSSQSGAGAPEKPVWLDMNQRGSMRDGVNRKPYFIDTASPIPESGTLQLQQNHQTPVKHVRTGSNPEHGIYSPHTSTSTETLQATLVTQQSSPRNAHAPYYHPATCKAPLAASGQAGHAVYSVPHASRGASGNYLHVSGPPSSISVASSKIYQPGGRLAEAGSTSTLAGSTISHHQRSPPGPPSACGRVSAAGYGQQQQNAVSKQQQHEGDTSLGSSKGSTSSASRSVSTSNLAQATRPPPPPYAHAIRHKFTKGAANIPHAGVPLGGPLHTGCPGPPVGVDRATPLPTAQVSPMPRMQTIWKGSNKVMGKWGSLENVSKVVANQRAMIAEQEDTIATIEADIAKCEGDSAQVHGDMDVMGREIQELEMQERLIRQKLDSFGPGKPADMEQEINTVKLKRTDMANELSSLRDKLRSCEVSMASKAQELKMLEHDFLREKSEASSEQEELRDLADQLKVMEGEGSSMERSLLDVEAEIQRAEALVKNKRERIERLRKDIEGLEKETTSNSVPSSDKNGHNPDDGSPEDKPGKVWV